MSNFYCEHCGAAIMDSPGGYVTGCEHYPLRLKSKYRSDIIVDFGVEPDPESLFRMRQKLEKVNNQLKDKAVE